MAPGPLTTEDIHRIANKLRTETMKIPTGITHAQAFDRLVEVILHELPGALGDE